MTTFTVESVFHDLYLPDVAQDLAVTEGGLIFRQGLPFAVLASGPDTDVVVDGAILSDGYALMITGAPDSADQSLTVGSTGLIAGGHIAVHFEGQGSIDNDGLIRGYVAFYISTALPPDGIGTGLEMTNTGRIIGTMDAIIVGSSTGSMSLMNSGTVEAREVAYGGSGGVDRVTNSGLINGAVALGDGADLIRLTATGRLEGDLDAGGEGDEVSNDGTIVGTVDLGAGHDLYASAGGRLQGDLLTGDGFDQVFNAGTIAGDVHLGGNNDIYVGRGGSVGGTVHGEEGYDTFIAGAGIDRFDGGEGIDVLDFSEGPGLRVSLADRSSTGAATGDLYVSIERVIGSNAGADVLIGDGLANTLDGRGGNDTLQGGGGDDWLLGGLGNDRLLGDAGNDRLIGEVGRDRVTGGAGDDAFVFLTLSDRGDRITDFGAGLGNDDRIEIMGEAFGGGLVAGALAASQFRARADNRAMDADDRFILRTSDKTLWFDADGRGGQASVMVADLQDNARFSAADILIV